MKRNVLTAPVLKTVRWGLMCLALCLASMPANAADEMANTLVYAGENEDTINPLLNNHQELPTIIFSGLMKYAAKGQPAGVPGLYFSSGEKIVKAELGNYDVFDFSNRTMYSYDVRLTNMLDVSNPSVRSQLGISLESIVGEGYDVTHAIGRYAYSNGYNGIIAPSARADGGINIILFNAKGVK